MYSTSRELTLHPSRVSFPPAGHQTAAVSLRNTNSVESIHRPSRYSSPNFPSLLPSWRRPFHLYIPRRKAFGSIACPFPSSIGKGQRRGAAPSGELSSLSVRRFLGHAVHLGRHTSWQRAVRCRRASSSDRSNT